MTLTIRNEYYYDRIQIYFQTYFDSRLMTRVIKLKNSVESSTLSKRRYFPRIRDQPTGYLGQHSVSLLPNRIRAQFELHTLQFYGIARAPR